MEMNYTNTGLWALLAAAVTLAATHTVSPDHWFPFVMVGRANKWRISWVLALAAIAGLCHVGTSVAIGLVGVFAKKGLSKELAGVLENATPMLLIIFGFGYAAYAWYKKRVGAHGHSHGIPIINTWLGIDPHAYALPDAGHGYKHDLEHAPHHDMRMHFGKIELYLHNIEMHIAVDHDDHMHSYNATAENNHEHAHEHGDALHAHKHLHRARGINAYAHGDEDQGLDHPNGHVLNSENSHGQSHIGIHGNDHETHKDNLPDKRAGWGLVAILGLTPCIALLPLTFAAVKYGTMAVIAVNVVFASATIGTILLFTWLGLLGLSWIKLDFFDEYGDIIAGAIIGLLGVATKIFGL